MNFTPKQKAGLAAIVVCVVLVIVWLLIKKKKKPKVATADGRPSAVTDIRLRPAGNDDEGPISNYANPYNLNKRGIIINFKTPITSGVVGDTTIKQYNIYLVDDATVITTTFNSPITVKTYIVSSTGAVYNPYNAIDSVANDFEWNDIKKGGVAGGLEAEIFIYSRMFATLTNASKYKIVIQAINSKNTLSPPTVSLALTYNECETGAAGACNWAGLNNAEESYTRQIGALATLAFNNDAIQSSASFKGTTVEGTPCPPPTGAPSGVLYKYNSTNQCKPKGCTDATMWLDVAANSGLGACTRKAVAGDLCTPSGIAGTDYVTGRQYIYYNQLDINGNIVLDNNNNKNPVLLCDDSDVTKVTDPRLNPCPAFRKITTLPTGTQWGGGGQGGCPIVCKSDTRISAGVYKATTPILELSTPCGEARECVFDGPLNKSAANKLIGSTVENVRDFNAGTWGSCPIVSCIPTFYGKTCSMPVPSTATYSPATPATTLSSCDAIVSAESNGTKYLFGLDNGMNPPQYVIYTIFGSGWRGGLGFGTSFSVAANGTLTLGTVTYQTPTGTAGTFYNFSACYKRVFLTSTGRMVIKCFTPVSTPVFAYNYIINLQTSTEAYTWTSTEITA